MYKTLFACLLSSAVPLSTGMGQSAEKTRIHVKTEEGKLKLTVFREQSFDSIKGLAQWFGRNAQGPTKSELVVQVDSDTRTAAIFPLLEKLHNMGFTNIRLALPKEHKDYIKNLGEGLQKQQMVSFGGWLLRYYEGQFQKRAAEFMWKDLNRALHEGKTYLALNLIFSMPESKTSSGKDSTFAVVVPGVALDDQAIQNYLTTIAGGSKRQSIKALILPAR